jgi:hypothetical protein
MDMPWVRWSTIQVARSRAGVIVGQPVGTSALRSISWKGERSHFLGR